MKNVEKIKPTGLFTNYIFKAIPLAFDESMSYYETLCGLLNYLKNTILPTLNNNADAIIEVQNLMTQLQNYVDNYFNNLDVQEEINNKLDKMVKDGTLAEIINQDIFTELNNKVNKNTNNINTLNNQVQNIQATVTTEIVVFGDSWSDLSVPESIWSTYAASQLRLNLHNYAHSGAGFVMPTNNLIETQINKAQNDTTYDKNLVKYVILCGGINDYRNNVNLEILRQKIIDLYNDCKTIFPNAKILYVNNFQYPYSQEQSSFWYKLQYNMSSSGVNVLNQDGFFKKAFFVNNLYHLTPDGQRVFGSNIISALTGGQIKNDGVLIHFNLIGTYMWLKRIDNMVMYILYVDNLSKTDTQDIEANEELCWVKNFSYKLMSCVGFRYTNAVAQMNNNNTITIAKNNVDTTSLGFSGIVPISVEI